MSVDVYEHIDTFSQAIRGFRRDNSKQLDQMDTFLGDSRYSTLHLDYCIRTLEDIQDFHDLAEVDKAVETVSKTVALLDEHLNKAKSRDEKFKPIFIRFSQVSDMCERVVRFVGDLVAVHGKPGEVRPAKKVTTYTSFNAYEQIEDMREKFKLILRFLTNESKVPVDLIVLRTDMDVLEHLLDYGVNIDNMAEAYDILSKMFDGLRPVFYGSIKNANAISKFESDYWYAGDVLKKLKRQIEHPGMPDEPDVSAHKSLDMHPSKLTSAQAREVYEYADVAEAKFKNLLENIKGKEIEVMVRKVVDYLAILTAYCNSPTIRDTSSKLDIWERIFFLDCNGLRDTLKGYRQLAEIHDVAEKLVRESGKVPKASKLPASFAEDLYSLDEDVTAVINKLIADGYASPASGDARKTNEFGG
jgi:hypothetical protein